MSYNAQRYETLLRLGIEQLPPLSACSSNESVESETCAKIVTSQPSPSMAIRERPVPGRKCPNCQARGQTIWVIPGKRCPQCGTEV
ncbi:hypothetical protein Slin15195_G003310 [Septoria linicola]|uniref:Uncharacterized protein n=1 Tax=Septoria linicola TaxID=215465 RepID=A0A9Q9EEX8_9PEZI|nr:hypothetical protein Slin14017_G003340 [Septoria linicola]USW47012.1 hypothetical protein Slin15195_G003310 [Septoria linicola]